MRKPTLVPAILFILIVLSNTVRAGNNLSVSYSPLNITQAMDLAVRNNSLYYLSAQETIASDTIDNKATVPKTGKLKSPTAALVIALVPGAVVHGAGHFYAGKTKTAIGLFGAEILGGVFVYFGALGSSLHSDTGGEGGSNAGPIVLFLGLGLFIGSWIYDIADSPSVIKSQNDQAVGKKPFPYELNMELDKGNQQIRCLVVKHF